MYKRFSSGSLIWASDKKQPRNSPRFHASEIYARFVLPKKFSNCRKEKKARLYISWHYLWHSLNLLAFKSKLMFLFRGTGFNLNLCFYNFANTVLGKRVLFPGWTTSLNFCLRKTSSLSHPWRNLRKEALQRIRN